MTNTQEATQRTDNLIEDAARLVHYLKCVRNGTPQFHPGELKLGVGPSSELMGKTAAARADISAHHGRFSRGVYETCRDFIDATGYRSVQ